MESVDGGFDGGDRRRAPAVGEQAVAERSTGCEPEADSGCEADEPCATEPPVAQPATHRLSVPVRVVHSALSSHATETPSALVIREFSSN